MKIKQWILTHCSVGVVSLLKLLRDSGREVFDPFPYRRYLRKKRCIFIHVPKAAGTSILSALGYAGPRDHCSYREFLKANPSKFNSYFKFGFVRDPYSRFRSLYKYFRDGGNGSTDLAIRDVIISNGLDLNDFCSYAYAHNLFMIHPMFWPQVLYLCNSSYEIQADWWGKVESIAHDYEYIAKRLGLPARLEHINATQTDSNPLEGFTESSIRILREAYRKDFEVFNYAS